jgi:hypothetical protein
MIVGARVEGITLELERMFEVRELLVAEARGLAQGAGCAHPAHGGVFVGESALEGHDHVAAVLHVVRDALEQGIVGDVERGDDEQLVGGEIRGGGKDEVRAHIHVIERFVNLLDQRVVAVGSARPAKGRHRPAIGHEADGVGGVAAPQDGHLVVNLQADEVGTDLFKLVRGTAHLGIGAVGLQIVRENALPVGFLVGGDRGPMPVLHHVGAVGEMGVDILAKLAVVGRKLAR